MDAIGRFVRGFGRFWYDFIVGDDPKIAVGVALVLAFGAALTTAGVTGAVVVLPLAVLLLAAFAVAMAVDVKRSHRRS